MTDAVQAAGFEWRGIVVWHKPAARPMLGAFRRDTEFVVYAVKAPAKAWSRRCFPGVFNHRVVAAEKVHLTGKPLPLLVDLLGVTPEGGTVLDPFTGAAPRPWPAWKPGDDSWAWSCPGSISSWQGRGSMQLLKPGKQGRDRGETRLQKEEAGYRPVFPVR